MPAARFKYVEKCLLGCPNRRVMMINQQRSVHFRKGSQEPIHSEAATSVSTENTEGVCENEASIKAVVAQGSEPPAKKRKIAVTARLYKDIFLIMALSIVLVLARMQGQCVSSAAKNWRTSLKATKLKRHLETLHPDFVDKPLDFSSKKTGD